MLLDEGRRKLDFLLSFYLRMRSSVARYEEYFESTDPRRSRSACQAGTGDRAQPRAGKAGEDAHAHRAPEADGALQKALENKQLVDAQTETVQEVLHLLRDQSYSMRDPRTITEQLDSLVSSAEETERGVRDMEDLLGIEQDGFLAGLADSDDLEAAERRAAGRPPCGRRPPQPPPVRLPPLPGPSGEPRPSRKKITH